MTSTQRAINELKLAGLFDKDSDYNGMIGTAVQELLEVFGKQGHSGFSAQHTANIFRKLVKGDVLVPIKKDDKDWVFLGDNKYQHKRLSSLFKDEKGVYYLNAIVWQGEDKYDTFTGTVEGVESRQYVNFPFMPKTFYINVYKDFNIDKRSGKDYVKDKKGKIYAYKIKNRKQLKEVFKYYNL